MVGSTKYRISDNMDGDWMPIEVMIATAEHPGLADGNLTKHSIYMRLLGLCWRLKRDELPSVYCRISVLKSALKVSDPDTLTSGLAQLADSQMVFLGDVHGNPATFRFVRVAGLRDKWKHHLKNAGNRTEQNWNRTELRAGAAEEPPLATPSLDLPVSRFSEIYATMRGINARVYRDLPENKTFDEVLATETARLGSDRVIAEAKRFALFLEDAFRVNDEKREKRHRPYKRFADWLNRSKLGDIGNGSNPRNESYTDRCLREAREAEAASG